MLSQYNPQFAYQQERRQSYYPKSEYLGGPSSRSNISDALDADFWEAGKAPRPGLFKGLREGAGRIAGKVGGVLNSPWTMAALIGGPQVLSLFAGEKTPPTIKMPSYYTDPATKQMMMEDAALQRMAYLKSIM